MTLLKGIRYEVINAITSELFEWTDLERFVNKVPRGSPCTPAREPSTWGFDIVRLLGSFYRMFTPFWASTMDAFHCLKKNSDLTRSWHSSGLFWDDSRKLSKSGNVLIIKQSAAQIFWWSRSVVPDEPRANFCNLQRIIPALSRRSFYAVRATFLYNEIQRIQTLFDYLVNLKVWQAPGLSSNVLPSCDGTPLV